MCNGSHSGPNVLLTCPWILPPFRSKVLPRYRWAAKEVQAHEKIDIRVVNCNSSLIFYFTNPANGSTKATNECKIIIHAYFNFYLFNLVSDT